MKEDGSLEGAFAVKGQIPQSLGETMGGQGLETGREDYPTAWSWERWWLGKQSVPLSVQCILVGF